MMVGGLGSFLLFLDGFFNVVCACFFKWVLLEQKDTFTLEHILQKTFIKDENGVAASVVHITQLTGALLDLTGGPIEKEFVWYIREVLRPANVDGSGWIHRDDFIWCMNCYPWYGQDAFMFELETSAGMLSKGIASWQGQGAQENLHTPLLSSFP